jgi:hypothetical protein
VISGVLGALRSVASALYVPVLMNWSAARYGLIGIAFSSSRGCWCSRSWS